MASNKKKLYGKSRTVPILNTSLDICAWITRGRIRKFVFSYLKKRSIPAEIVNQLAGEHGRKSGSYYAQVSRALAELEAQNLVKCLNPKEKTGRFYQLTKKGLRIFKELS